MIMYTAFLKPLIVYEFARCENEEMSNVWTNGLIKLS